MSVTKAEQLANEWWWYVSRYAKKHPKFSTKSICGGYLCDMIARDILQCEPDMTFSAGDTAAHACKILRERLEKERGENAGRG
jgi:hypothetical protein